MGKVAVPKHKVAYFCRVMVDKGIISELAWRHGHVSFVSAVREALTEVFGDRFTCNRCLERERIIATLPQDGSRGQKDAWDDLTDRAAKLDRIESAWRDRFPVSAFDDDDMRLNAGEVEELAVVIEPPA